MRKSILFAPASFVEGWAHYCEQMMVEAGFGAGQHRVKLGQLAEALIRLARFIVGIKLHMEDMSVEQGMRFFRDEAFMEEASARREAERGTFDPTYLVYSVGQADAAEAARDYKQQQGKKYSLRAFHDSCWRNGTATFWLHRQLMLGDDPATCWNRLDRDMPLYEYQCDACGHRFEEIQKLSDPPLEDVPEMRRGTVHKLVSRPAIQFKGTGWYITDYAKKSSAGTDTKSGAAKESGDSKESGESKESEESKESAKSRESKESKTPAPAVEHLEPGQSLGRVDYLPVRLTLRRSMFSDRR